MEDFEDIDVIDLYFKRDTVVADDEMEDVNDPIEITLVPARSIIQTTPVTQSTLVKPPIVMEPTAGPSRTTCHKSNKQTTGESNSRKGKGVGKSTATNAMLLEKRIRELEQESETRKRKFRELEEENKRLKAQEKTETKPKMAFKLDHTIYLHGDMKEANVYLSKTIVPQVKAIISQNKQNFRLISELGKVCEPVHETSPRTCIQFNRGKICMDGEVHFDRRGNKRIHCCSICWETLWAFVPHRVVDCPLLTRKFWEIMECKIDYEKN